MANKDESIRLFEEHMKQKGNRPSYKKEIMSGIIVLIFLYVFSHIFYLIV